MFLPCSVSVLYSLTPDGSYPSYRILPSLLNYGLPITIVSGSYDFIANEMGVQWMIGNLTWKGATGFQVSLDNNFVPISYGPTRK